MGGWPLEGHLDPLPVRDPGSIVVEGVEKSDQRPLRLGVRRLNDLCVCCAWLGGFSDQAESF